MAGSEDELALTKTAPSDPAKPNASTLAGTLGRYRIERTLGEGGMGVVHAAFDPDLERRVALKVLRATDEDGEARQRLLREARAMARLAHANVVSVHEVGSASGRDYVAMELIDGETLNDWLKHAKPHPREIIAAFIAAGRGLAAAHVAGLVHRDFKPHNVLRGRDGRIVVTDFGLARGVEVGLGLEATLDGRSDSANTPSSLSGLTRTGSVLGTPAYMAPEQWTGGTVGPAADQFAFCIALWEALTGTRPYAGSTFEELKAAVAAGPGKLDASKLPRALRAALIRGLDPDPAKRWPNMEALLATLVRAERRPVALAALALAGVVVVGVVVYLAVRPATSHTAIADCAPPARDVAQVWTADASKALTAAGRGEVAEAIDRDIAAWRTARTSGCAAHDAPRLACLDGALERVEIVHRALEKLTINVDDAAIESLIDPAVCKPQLAPRLAIRATPDTIDAFAMLLDGTVKDHKTTVEDVDHFLARPALTPCVKAVALRAKALVAADDPASKAALVEAVNTADECGDDRLRADTLVEEAPYEVEQPIAGPRAHAAIDRAKVAVDRVAQPDLVAELDEERAKIAAEEEHWDEAFSSIESSIAGYGARSRPQRQLEVVAVESRLRLARGDAPDLVALRAAVVKWKPVAVQRHLDRIVHSLEQKDAYARFFLGDVEGGHADILRLWKPQPQSGGVAVDGMVVDDQGKPVANATVAVDMTVVVDSIGPVPINEAPTLRIVTTDAHGVFAIPDAVANGTIVAQTDAKHRSLPQPVAPHVKLVLAATRKLAGTVAFDTTAPSNQLVIASVVDHQPGGFVTLSPIKPDGSYSLDGVSTAAIKVGVAVEGVAMRQSVTFTKLGAGTADQLSLALSASSTGRTLDVIVRSQTAAPLDVAQVFVMPGKADYKVASEMMTNHQLSAMQIQFAKPIVGASPKSTEGKTRTGDLIAHFANVVTGEVSVCAIGLNGDFHDPKVAQALQAHVKELAMKCVTPTPDAATAVIETPPQKRFD